VLFRGLMMVVMVFEKNIQKFSSHTVSKLGGMFRMKKSLLREFFLRSIPGNKVYLQEKSEDFCK